VNILQKIAEASLGRERGDALEVVTNLAGVEVCEVNVLFVESPDSMRKVTDWEPMRKPKLDDVLTICTVPEQNPLTSCAPTWIAFCRRLDSSLLTAVHCLYLDSICPLCPQERNYNSEVFDRTS
jgi:hypothetical protein